MDSETLLKNPLLVTFSDIGERLAGRIIGTDESETLTGNAAIISLKRKTATIQFLAGKETTKLIPEAAIM